MSKDSSYTYVHLHASHHVDFFEEFFHPPSSTSSSSNSASNNAHHHNAPQTPTTTDPADPALTHVPGHFLPFESINLPAHLMPVNPEDEDGVVPDMHAAFGINRAMAGMDRPDGTGERSGRGVTRQEERWGDLGVARLVGGVDEMGLEDGGSGPVRGGATGNGVGRGVRREGVRSALLNVR